MNKYFDKRKSNYTGSGLYTTEPTRKSWLRRNDTKVLVYILQSGNLYGTERMALATLEALDEYPIRVIIAPAPQSNGKGSVTQAAQSMGYGSAIFATRWDLFKILARLFFRFQRVDIIGNGVSQAFICQGLSKLLLVNARQLHVVHGGTQDQHAYGTRFHLNRMSIRLIAVSNFVEAKLVKYGVQKKSIDVIENFVSNAQLVNQRCRATYLNHSPWLDDVSHVKVAIVSRVDPIKRIDLLIESIERGGLGKFKFDVYGTGTDLEVLRARAISLPNICFHGFVDDVKDRLAKVDFLLHLCPDEPFGLAVLEGFIAGVVAIVPAAGGAGSIIEDGITGFKFEPNSSTDLTKTLVKAATSSPDQLQELANEATLRLDYRFSQRQGATQYRASFDLVSH